MAMTKVAEVVVGSGGSASIEFTNIPQTGKDLVLLASIRSNRTVDTADLFNVYFNNDTNFSNYPVRTLRGTGSAASSLTSDAAMYVPNANATANTFGNGLSYISNYTSSANKTMSQDGVSEHNDVQSFQGLAAVTWNNSAAITSMQLVSRYGTGFLQHSTASLYIIS